MIGDILQAVGSVYNNERSLYWQTQEAEKARLFNAEQAELQRNWTERMWNMNNAYNSPAAQMQRARDAGLNPSMLYGQPIAESQPATGGAEASTSIPSVPHLSNPFDGFALLSAQKNLLNAQADEVRSRIPVNEAKVGQIRAATDDLLASVSQRMADVNLKFAQTKLTDEQRENISFEQMMKQNYFDLDKQKMYKDFQLTDAQIEKLDAETKSLLARAKVTERELFEMIWTFAVRAQGLQKQNMLTDSQINQANATADKLRKEGIRLDQVVTLDKPNEINSQQWADDMSGKNGVVNQVGSNITYQFVNTIERVGRILLK